MHRLTLPDCCCTAKKKNCPLWVSRSGVQKVLAEVRCLFGVLPESIPASAHSSPASCRSFSPDLHLRGSLWGTRRESRGKCFRGMGRRRTGCTGARGCATTTRWHASTLRQYRPRSQTLKTIETRARGRGRFSKGGGGAGAHVNKIIRHPTINTNVQDPDKGGGIRKPS